MPFVLLFGYFKCFIHCPKPIVLYLTVALFHPVWPIYSREFVVWTITQFLILFGSCPQWNCPTLLA